MSESNLGAFYAELNRTILQMLTGEHITNVVIRTSIEQNPSNQNTTITASIHSDWLLPSYAFVHIFHGELIAFIIAWNLIIEYVVCMALISKVFIQYFDEIAFDGMAFSLQHLIKMSWAGSDYFDVVGFFVPIVIGGEFNMLFKICEFSK